MAPAASKTYFSESGVQPQVLDFDFSRLQLNLKTNNRSELPPLESLRFGNCFTDHILEADWDASTGWGNPVIRPFSTIEMHPACSALHYGLQVFEGMKAFRQIDGGVVMFRPEMNIARLSRSCKRMCLPDFNRDQLLKSIDALVNVESSFVPNAPGYSLYIRPVVFSTQPTLGVTPPQSAKLLVMCSPVGPYFPEGFKPIRILADDKYVRAWPGGAGESKAGGNYGSTIMPQREALEKGCSQILWLFPNGEGDYYITEAGTMNIFVHWITPEGQEQLVTFPLESNLILPGVTRDSIMSIARDYDDFHVVEYKLKMFKDFLPALKEGRVLEMFGTGTACVISPIKEIVFQDEQFNVPMGPGNSGVSNGIGPLGERLLNSLRDIQYGRVGSHSWCHVVETTATLKCPDISAEL